MDGHQMIQTEQRSEIEIVKLPDLDKNERKGLLTDLEKRDKPLLATQAAYGPG